MKFGAGGEFTWGVPSLPRSSISPGSLAALGGACGRNSAWEEAQGELSALCWAINGIFDGYGQKCSAQHSCWNC